MLLIDEDVHVHSTFSDGKHTLEENIRQATQRGLRALVCVDHVRRDTAWVADFAAAVARARKGATIEVKCGLEAKILDEKGTLDLPVDYRIADWVYMADHRLPIGAECLSPAEVKDRLRDGKLTASRAVEALVRAMANAMWRYHRVVLAHPFSFLPKIGLSEDCVSAADLKKLASLAAMSGATLEVSERWRCPSTRTIAAFRAANVPVRFATDSHSADTVGIYDWVATTARDAGLVRA